MNAKKPQFVLLIVLENAVQHLKPTLSDKWKSDAALFSYSLFSSTFNKKLQRNMKWVWKGN